MKKLLVFIIIVGVLVAVAWKMKWIGVENTETTTIGTFNKDKAKEDISKAVEKTKELGQEAVDKAKELGAKAVDKTKETAKKVEDKVSDEKKELTK